MASLFYNNNIYDNKKLKTLSEGIRPNCDSLVTTSGHIIYAEDVNRVFAEDDYYINDEVGKGMSVASYYDDVNTQLSKKVPLIWDVKDNITIATYEVLLSTKEDLSDAKVYETTEKSLCLENLFAATTYYWKVKAKDGSYSSAVSSFTTEDYVRMISSDGIINVRDIGGRMTLYGRRVKQGIIFRGAEVVRETYKAPNSGDTHTKTTSAISDKVFNEELKIGLEIDLRGKEESNNLTASEIGENVIYDRQSIGAYDYFCNSSSKSVAEFKDIFTQLGNANDKHVYFHCWGGADRTGTIGFLINGLLGVSYTDLVIDYELTSFSRNLRTKEDMDNKIGYFTTFMNKLKTKYCGYNETTHKCSKTIAEGIETYLIDLLGFTKEEVETIRNNLLEEAK